MEPKLKEFSIMVVDDDNLVQKLVADVLKNLGFGKVYRADDGNTAIRMLERVTVDFIFCDWRMPEMTGPEFIKKVRTGQTRANPMIPIIMLTGNAEQHQVIEARNVGANDYLIKPFTVRQITKRIIELVDHPREFVAAPKYLGPCRRRKVAGHKGTERRKNRKIKGV
ncbi:MAG: response regulator [Alphaproteobacteria bacterium]|nr:response regulator [Alphaproteobacteria bacterium]